MPAENFESTPFMANLKPFANTPIPDLKAYY